jgi:hypothetical protein
MVLALVGAALLIVSEFTPVIRIVVGDDVTKKTISGGDRHAYSLIVVALAGAAMAVGAWRGNSRPAMAALAALGALALLIAVVRDVPALDDTGVYGLQYEDASAGPALGFYLETLGGALLLIAGGAWLMLAGGPGGDGGGGGSDRAGRRRPPVGPHDDAPEPEGEPALR